MQANEEEKVDGIIVYYPVFHKNPTHDKYVQETVDLTKDVEGLRHKHLHNMYHNTRFLDAPENKKKSILPCTPLAVVKILEHLQIYNPILASGNRLFGKTITVINRSEVNGRPLAALLANDGATVYSVDITGVQLFTRGQGIKKPRHQVEDKEGWGLEQCLPLSDVIIGGVPVESFKVPTELIRDGAVCINFSSFKNFDGPAIKEKASIYVPSVGKVTIAILLRNLVVSQAQTSFNLQPLATDSILTLVFHVASHRQQTLQRLSRQEPHSSQVRCFCQRLSRILATRDTIRLPKNNKKIKGKRRKSTSSGGGHKSIWLVSAHINLDIS